MTNNKITTRTKFDNERIAMILVEALYLGDAATSQKWDITTRTILNYRNRLNSDSHLSEVFAQKKDAFELDWTEQIPMAIRAGIEFLIRAFKEADHKDPNAMHAVAGAMKVMTEIGLAKEVIDVRLGRSNRQNRNQNDEMATISQASE